MNLKVKNLQLSWSDFSLRVVNWHLASGEQVHIEGPSGCGKTSFLHALAGLIPVHQGEIYAQDFRIHAASVDELANFRRQNMGLILQRIHLLSHLTLLENVQLGSSNNDRALHYCEALGLEHRLNHLPSQLSLGETQRAAVARALVAQPKVLLADEPTSGLDDLNTRKVLELILQECAKSTLVVVSHDARVKEYIPRVQVWREVMNS
jgi:putative ABC transport system ATP-binding protein